MKILCSLGHESPQFGVRIPVIVLDFLDDSEPLIDERGYPIDSQPSPCWKGEEEYNRQLIVKQSRYNFISGCVDQEIPYSGGFYDYCVENNLQPSPLAWGAYQWSINNENA